MRYSALCALLSLAACSFNSMDEADRLYQKARFDYQLHCIDQLVDGYGQTLEIARQTCQSYAREEYPPLAVRNRQLDGGPR